MKQFLRDYFSFNRRERTGILVLLGILASLFFLLAYMHSGEFIQRERGAFVETELETEGPWKAPFKKQTETTGRKFVDSDATSRSELTPEPGKLKQSFEYFYFNPNILTREGWEKLGVSKKLAKTILNYVSKGGKFRKKEDLKKIYGLREEEYSRLESYIRIPEDSVRSKVPKPNSNLPFGESKGQTPLPVSNKIQPGHHLELNAADSVALLMLPCIGPSFAKRILAYRIRLGGFVSSDQLKEIFGFDDERFNCLSDRVEVDLSEIHKLNINSASADELKKHPYIRWNVAKLIESYRKQHGPYHSLDELKKLALIDEALYNRISPYLSIE